MDLVPSHGRQGHFHAPAYLINLIRDSPPSTHDTQGRHGMEMTSVASWRFRAVVDEEDLPRAHLAIAMQWSRQFHTRTPVHFLY